MTRLVIEARSESSLKRVERYLRESGIQDIRIKGVSLTAEVDLARVEQMIIHHYLSECVSLKYDDHMPNSERSEGNGNSED